METLHSKVVADGLIYPEGIRWHRGLIWFSDILDQKVCALDPETLQMDVVTQTEDRPSGLGFLPDGRLLIATMHERKLLRLDADGLKTVAELKSVGALLNDMVVDPTGRAYMDCYFAGGEPHGAILLVEPDGAYRIVADDLRMPNGLAITDDGKILIASEFKGNRIVEFDITADGGLTNRRSFAELGSASPDGLCLDAEGAVWVGLPFQNRFQRIKEGGEVTHEIVYENKWGIAPVLGGTGRRTLFLCTSDVTPDKFGRLMRQPHTARGECNGWIEAVAGIAVPGVGWP